MISSLHPNSNFLADTTIARNDSVGRSVSARRVGKVDLPTVSISSAWADETCPPYKTFTLPTLFQRAQSRVESGSPFFAQRDEGFAKHASRPLNWKPMQRFPAKKVSVRRATPCNTLQPTTKLGSPPSRGRHK